MSRSQPFLNIRTEGALLPSDLLARLLEGANLPGLRPEDYHLGAGEKLNEAISRSWTRLLSLWGGFRKSQATLPASDLGTTLTREKWLLQLFQELGYGRLLGASAFEIDGKSYPISHLWHGQHYQVPVHLVSFRAELDKRSEQKIQGASKASPHGLVQEFLNRSEPHLWAFVSNGLRLRLLRDNASLTRQAHVEFDLEGIFEGEAYADFRLLWMVCHQSRVEGSAKERPETCWLEEWSKQAQSDGRRALEHLREGVQKALEAFGTGFISHKANQVLRNRLQAGELSKSDLYRQLLRIAYRLIFLFVAEDRNLLHAPDASEEARSRYARFYSGQRLRRLAERSRGGCHSDLWVGLRLIFKKLGDDQGCTGLGLPALGGFLFGPSALPDLESAEISNEQLLLAIRNLGLVRDRSGWRLVDYRNLGSEELGSIYESLLELSPTMELENGIFSLGVVGGNQRKTSGSYYTPDELVQCLLDSALAPVVEAAILGKSPKDAEHAILALKVCDPAVGSGHFLVGAAHRLAGYLARTRAQADGESEFTPIVYQSALRDVIGHCLYGVDLNPMAAELCRVSLWLESIDPGKPLTFLDHHIRVGNSLLGTTPELISSGIPDEAFTPIEGDDRTACSKLKRLNRGSRSGQGPLFYLQDSESSELLQRASAAIEELPDDIPEKLHAKELAFHRHELTKEYLDKKLLADTWCAAFVIRKRFLVPGRDSSVYGITQSHLDDLAYGRGLATELEQEVIQLANSYQFFHWHLAFPEVFSRGGFDCVLGNPPWERVKLQEKEWFSERSPEIANAPNASARKRLISVLIAENPKLHQLYLEDSRKAEGEGNMLRRSGAYPNCGCGDVNTYAVFAELSRRLMNSFGRLACVLPLGIATDDTTKDFFRDLVSKKHLVSVIGFINEKMLFPQVLHNFKFCILSISGYENDDPSYFAFNCYSVDEAKDPDRLFNLTSEQILLLNPETGTCPTFFFRKSAILTLAIYRRLPVMSALSQNHRIELSAMLHMGEASSMFKTAPEIGLLPVYESKMLHQFNHRFASFHLLAAGERSHMLPETPSELLEDPTFSPSPCYWIPEGEVTTNPNIDAKRSWIIASRRITSAGLQRTCIYAVIPLAGASDSITVVNLPEASIHTQGSFIANMNSFVFDFITRQKQAGANLSFFVKRQLPIVRFDTYSNVPNWSEGISLGKWIMERVLELTYTAWDLNGFARDCEWSGQPFHWDEERRFMLRCELDAAFFRLYLSAEINGAWHRADGETDEELRELQEIFPSPRDAVVYILDTFSIIRRREEDKYKGDFRSKRVILEIYDAMQEGIRTGQGYQTRLVPPPSDPSCCHPPMK